MPAPVGRWGTRCPSHSSFAKMEGKRKFEDEEGLAVKKRKKDKSLKKAKKDLRNSEPDSKRVIPENLKALKIAWKNTKKLNEVFKKYQNDDGKIRSNS